MIIWRSLPQMAHVCLRILTAETWSRAAIPAAAVKTIAISTIEENFMRNRQHFGSEKVCLNRHPID
jgi:hypothetical protein